GALRAGSRVAHQRVRLLPGCTADPGVLRLGLRGQPREQRVERSRHAQPPPLSRMVTATTKPRITTVSGIAIRMIAVVESSGFSARLAASAGPIRDCAQAVARAARPMASAALRGIQRTTIPTPSSGGLPRVRCPMSERLIAGAAGAVERPEELDVVQA